MFKFKQQITWQKRTVAQKNVEIMAPLKYLSSNWTIEMPLINLKNCLQLRWSKNCFLVAGTVANQEPIFRVTGTKLYVSVVT